MPHGTLTIVCERCSHRATGERINPGNITLPHWSTILVYKLGTRRPYRTLLCPSCSEGLLAFLRSQPQ